MAAVVRARLNRQVMGRLRLASQGLIGPGFGSAPEAVRSMTAMQAQDLPASLWAVGQRVPGSRAADVRSALDRGGIVRSWPMRGTLHLLAPEDLKWILAITSGRVLKSLAGRHRQLDISAADVDTAAGAALQRLAGGAAASRAELFGVFERAGQSTAGQRGIHLLAALCQEAILVLGPLAGNQQLVVGFDDWIRHSRSLDRAEGIAEWLLRYFRSHGPATERDFAWWSGIPLTETRAALAEVCDQLVGLEFDGRQYWLSPDAAALLDDGVPGQRTVLALPAFDEFLLGYTDRSVVLPAHHSDKIVPGGNGVFKRTIVAGGQVVGTWAAAWNSRGAAVVPEPFDAVNGLRPAARKSFELQAAKYRRFVGG
ncbi:winged helix DNA-binding domain-containing protein [Arthrobacter sp. B3I4]|uniref:winged helix DNA-binding domain-containing protein n=1 Tax=Arthrobacter sp. B3I4 TaxID=3042267 RepID=UPI002782F867|nr:winged helix DNA-binding domain-containing protein [Arthrobacter sp. B3I4]MDQ0755429.1 hypothetical protein [Arthrobacter sp. B3I4]